ncbi:MAG: flagellar biosynthetic protein FliO [Candidatus Omnitrophica bacterium]|nr:flagellar biosynthetic protein FliO [Candidatus Omnitrophota bacterium]MCA9415771.1 flagellar biosynthetic protein FliO [Candidatus Omnitrophota bacterium]MCA9439242.1 flagellar biosynthetic protein FliO [Candidatus Omnitrophota bacterium]MCA9446896.1 flagellar biosynthetic protein FliO [Candidatus Omnitrophota bacterium]MCB9768160.1 flagellar biosynthetic protein FliO [Candidatus Omnitrophota bacterium]
MKSALGWLLTISFLWHCGTCHAETPGAASATPETTVGTVHSNYHFDADRFAQAMDRASKDPIESGQADQRLAPNTASLTSVLGRTILSLLIVIGAIYGLSYGLKRMGMKTAFQTVGPLRVLAKQGLSQKSSIYIVSTLDRFLIIGESAQGLTCLSELSDPDEVDRLKREWGWNATQEEESGSLFQSGKSLFSPTLRSHMDDLERELQEYEEARR